MSTTRKVIYYVAMSVDHYIAHTDESIDGFLMEGRHIADYLKDLRDYDTVLMGRRTYEWGYQFGVEPGQAVPTYAHMAQYVFSKKMPDSQHEQLQVIRDDPAEFVKQLKTESGGSIYLCGGGELAGHLLQQGVVDELILKINPVLFGKGIPLFGAFDDTIPLSLLNANIYDNGAVFLHYAVEKRV